MKVILSHPTGNANVRAVAKGFREGNILAEFDTAIACFPGSPLYKLADHPPLAEIRRRALDVQLKPFTRTLPWIETGRLLSSRAGMTRLIAHETGIFSIDAVFKSHDQSVAKRIKKLAKNGLTGIYAYEDGAINSFKAAKARNIACFYDLPIAYWRASRHLLQHERERWPAWASTLTSFKDSDLKLEKKDEELALADCIFVASTFTADSLKYYPGNLAPVNIVPYGFPDVPDASRCYDYAGQRPLKLLFVGGLSQRKGIADLFDVVAKLGRHVELTVVGRKVGGHCQALDDALAIHKWIPSLPHEAILQLMREHDVLVFPSLFEGFGLVITEAMAQGTPVITTERTAGPDLIENDTNGWLVPAGVPEKLFEAIDYLLQHPEKVKQNGIRAMLSARARPWNLYSLELTKAVSAVGQGSKVK